MSANEEKKEEEVKKDTDVAKEVKQEVEPRQETGSVKTEPNLVDLKTVSDAATSNKTMMVADAEGIVDTEKMALDLKKRETSGETKKKFTSPKLFVKRDELEEIEIEVIFSQETGEVFSITRKGIMAREMLKDFGVTDYMFKFEPVNYQHMMLYRKAASFYDQSSKELVINRLQLRSFLLINHLKYTNLAGPNGESIKLEFDKEHNNLNTKTLSLLYDTIPSLMEIVLSLFEKKMLMAFQTSE